MDIDLTKLSLSELSSLTKKIHNETRRRENQDTNIIGERFYLLVNVEPEIGFFWAYRMTVPNSIRFS